MNKGFNGPLDHTHKVVDAKDNTGGLIFKNSPTGGKTMIGLRSNTKAANNPTSDSDDGGVVAGASQYNDDKMFGTKVGQATLDGAHGNNAGRKLAYGN